MQSTARIAVAAVALLSIAAFGQESTTTTQETQTTTTQDPLYTTDQTTTRTVREENRPNLITPIGLAVDVGGGVHGFVDRTLNNLTNTGGAWEARLTVGTRTYIGGELAYVGTADPIADALVLGNRAVLVSNGVEALLRVNAMLDEWQPYAVAGYTYRRFNLQNTTLANTSALADGADDSEIPVGVGVAYRFKGFIADARFMVHPSVSSQLVPTADTLPTALSLQGKIGFEF